MWSSNYFPCKIICFFKTPDEQSVYAVVHSTKSSNHDNDSILFERWEMEYSIKIQQNGERNISPMFHVVDVDTFGSPILAIKDYNISQLSTNTESAMVTVVIPFETAWPNKFMSSYRR